MTGQDEMTNALWQTLLKSALETEEYEIDCQECFNLLDLYADLLLDDETSADKIMPAVQQHLSQCNCCVKEFEALMVMLQEALAKDSSIASPFEG